jgi:hypothetical protein
MATPNPDVVIIESDPKHQNDGTSLLPKNSIYNGDDGTDICEPRSLDAGRSHTVDAVISLCMIATAVPLLGFAVIIGRLHGKPVGGGRSWDIIQFIYTKVSRPPICPSVFFMLYRSSN